MDLLRASGVLTPQYKVASSAQEAYDIAKSFGEQISYRDQHQIDLRISLLKWKLMPRAPKMWY